MAGVPLPYFQSVIRVEFIGQRRYGGFILTRNPRKFLHGHFLMDKKVIQDVAMGGNQPMEAMPLHPFCEEPVGPVPYGRYQSQHVIYHNVIIV